MMSDAVDATWLGVFVVVCKLHKVRGSMMSSR